MKYDLTGLLSVLTTNTDAMTKEMESFQKEIDKANAFVRADKAVKNEQSLKDGAKVLRKYAEKCAYLELLANKCKELKTKTLTDEQVKRTLCKARQFSTWFAKQIKETGCFELASKSVDYDVSGILAELGIDVGFKADIGLLAVTLALRAAENIEDKDKDKIISQYRLNDKVKEKIKAGADLSSKRQATLAIQDVLNSFLPEANYKAVNKDWEWFLLGGTSLDKKTLGAIKVADVKTVEKMVYDYVSLLERNNGIAQYSVTYKTGKEEAAAPAPEAEKPETAAEEPAAPVEEKAAKEPTKQEKPKRERKSKTGKKADEAAA